MNKMSRPPRRALLATTAGVALAGVTSPRAWGAADRPPNFVFIFCDDLGYGDLGCYGHDKIKTPVLDRMAAEGLKFTQFYSCAPVCTPSRAALLTGRYQIRSGLTRVLFPGAKTGISDYEVTLAEALKSAGYATACVGKWHLGDQPQYLPTRHGFDRYFGIPYSNDMRPCKLLRDEQEVENPAKLDTLTQRYTEEAVKFIADSKGKPFFLYLPHTMPHTPLAANPKFAGRSARGLYGDVVEEIDWSTGEILKALKDHGVDDNTIVAFTSDNGPWLIRGEHGGSAGPLRNGKGTTFEGGVREPCIVRWPGRIKPGRVVDRPAIMVDWFPTFVMLAGGKVPQDRIIDGCDIGPVLLGAGKRAHEEFFFYAGDTLQAHRSGDWKLRVTKPSAPATTAAAGKAGKRARPDATTAASKPREDPVMLFNLAEDPSETTNLADKHPDVVKRLMDQMAAFEKTVPAPTTR